MSYFDFVVYSAPRERQADVEAFARTADAIFVEHGALRVVDCVGDDVPPGKATDFYRAVAAEDGEQVFVGFVQWPDKATRDPAMGRIMSDPRMSGLTVPFDGKRMIFGGFTPFVDIQQ